MPFYDYHCEKCNKTFEVFQNMTEKPIRTCKFCSGKVQKVISAPGVIFKGAGWYITDYPSNDRKEAMEAERKKAGEQSVTTSCPAS